MSCKETLFFIGKCLTINYEQHNRVIVEEQLKSNSINWDDVTVISTSHFVFPALYHNLKRSNFLHYLPNDLVEYMQHFANLNRNRNLQIIKQAEELNEVLLANKITPIFLKGTANLLQGLYEDIAERMVGDIDFLVDKENYSKAYEVLQEFGYKPLDEDVENHFPLQRHKPRIRMEGRIASVEVHIEMLNGKYISEFNYQSIIKNTLKQDNFCFLGYSDKLSLSIIACQINDNEQFYFGVNVRNIYDTYLLSQKTNSLKSINNYKLLFEPLNNFLAVSSKVLNTKKIIYKETKASNHFLKKAFHFLDNYDDFEKSRKKIKKKLFYKRRIRIIKKSFFDKEMRNQLIKRVKEKNWRKDKLRRIFAKPKN